MMGRKKRNNQANNINQKNRASFEKERKTISKPNKKFLIFQIIVISFLILFSMYLLFFEYDEKSVTFTPVSVLGIKETPEKINVEMIVKLSTKHEFTVNNPIKIHATGKVHGDIQREEWLLLPKTIHLMAPYSLFVSKDTNSNGIPLTGQFLLERNDENMKYEGNDKEVYYQQTGKYYLVVLPEERLRELEIDGSERGFDPSDFQKFYDDSASLTIKPEESPNWVNNYNIPFVGVLGTLSTLLGTFSKIRDKLIHKSTY